MAIEARSVDVAVCSMVLCSVRRPAAALGELRRVLRPGGTIRFLEHVASPVAWRARAQRVADATVWPRVSGGCHVGRDTTTLMSDADFVVDEWDRFAFGIPPFDPPKTFVIGEARLM